MDPFTRKLWDQQNRHVGDRERLFQTVGAHVDATYVLYPGSFVDVAASMTFDDVTYVDLDARADRFFRDSQGIREILNGRLSEAKFRFLAGDYQTDLDLADTSYDLLISLYAGFVSEHCTRYLKVGGTLLVNGSHGDASMASIDDRYQLVGVVVRRPGNYLVQSTSLDTYLVPKTAQEVSIDRLHELGKGIGYTKSPFAYLFERIK